MDFREESEMDIPVSHRREDYYLIPPQIQKQYLIVAFDNDNLII